MKILFIDSNKDFIENLKYKLGDQHHYVLGLHQSLGLLENVTDFDKVVANYYLDDAKGKDLHENYRMLPETEKIPIVFYSRMDHENVEDIVKKMDNTSYLKDPTIDDFIDNFKESEVTKKVDLNQPDFEALFEEATKEAENKDDKKSDNQPDFEALFEEATKEAENKDDEKSDNQPDFEALFEEATKEAENKDDEKSDNQPDFEALFEEATKEAENKDDEKSDNQPDFEALFEEATKEAENKDDKKSDNGLKLNSYKKTILIVEPNKEFSENIEKKIDGQNIYKVLGLNDSLMLLEDVTEFDLAVVNYHLNDGNGKDLHENYRMLPETVDVPILIYFNKKDQKALGYTKNMDNIEVLELPSEDDIVDKIYQMLNISKNGDNDQDSSNKKEKTISNLSLNEKFSGDLKEFSIIKILEEAANYKDIVKLTINNTISEEVCEIYINNEEIIDVKMEDFEPEDALFWVLNWEDGDFSIELIDSYSNIRVEIPLDEIIKDVVLKKQEFEDLAETLPDLNTILIPSPSYDPDKSEFDEEYKEIIAIFDGNLTINDVVALYKNDNLYALTIISQLYMNEILIEKGTETSEIVNQELLEPQKDDLFDTSDDDLLAQYGIDDDDLDDSDLLENYGVDEDELDLSLDKEEGKEVEEKKDLKISTDVLEDQDVEFQLDKDSYVKEIVESFKYDKEIEFTRKPEMYMFVMMGLTAIIFVLGFYLIFYGNKPKKVIIHNITKKEEKINKIEVFHLGFDNKVKYYKNSLNSMKNFLKYRVLKNSRKIKDEQILSKKSYLKSLKEGSYYFKRGNFKKAISIYKKLLKKLPKNGDILLSLASAYYADENSKEALRVIEKLDLLGYKSSDFTLLKAQIYQTTNNLTEAIENYQNYIELEPTTTLKRDIEIIVRSLAREQNMPLNR